MSVTKADTYLITIKPKDLNTEVENLFASGIDFEVLSPDTLQGPWDQTQTFAFAKTNNEENLNLLASVIEDYSPKGLLASLTDNRSVGTFDDIQKASQDRINLLSIAKLLKEYKDIEKAEQEYIKIKKQLRKKSFAVGLGVTSFDLELAKFVAEVLARYKQNHPEGPEIIFDTPQVILQSFGVYTAIIYQPQDAQVLEDFLLEKGYTGEVRMEKDYVKHLKIQKKEVRRQLEMKGFTPIKLGSAKLKQMSACHASLQIEDRLSDAKNKIFRVSEEAHLYFLFLAVRHNNSSNLEKFLTKSEILYEKVDWSEEILEWKQGGDLESFRTIPASLGTIGKNESDPTLATAITFSVFFAFCLGDALYGLIITLICGGLLFFTHVKQSMRNILTIFFWSGLATVFYGALTKSWAGDLFDKTILNTPLSSLQLLNPLVLNSPDGNNPAINTLLIEAGNIHPIVALLALSLVIGLITIFAGYALKLNTAIRSKAWADLASQLTWIGFLGSLFSWLVASSLSTVWEQVAFISLLIFAIGLFVFNSGKGLVGRFMGGLGNVYGLISFGSDILSFTRLIAVGLTSGIIASVVNLLTFLVYDSITIPVVNIIVASLMLLIGHTFNLVIALFGAYINPLRLNYVEFYPKFFEGKGRQIKTLHTEFSYLRIHSI